MKNAINYYYNLYADKIHQTNQKYRFETNNQKYVLMPVDRTNEEVKELYNLTLNLYQKNFLCHQFVLNKDGNLITIINNIPYALFIVYNDSNLEINLEDIIKLSDLKSTEKSLRRDNWLELWKGKVDYIEYQMSQFGKKYPLINESLNYYIGLSETSISLLQYIPNYQNDVVVNHRRLRFNTTVFEFYNPLNFVLDTRVRDVIEYFKSLFFQGEDITEDLKRYIYINKLNRVECLLLLARLIFPTFYFDLYEDILISNLDEKVILKILNKASDYQKFISNIYMYLKDFINIPEIEWLKKDVSPY